MPRPPSLKDQRSGEILDAYLTCVARFGLDGATQERIAKEAGGVKRPLLRHYLGNRDQMIIALTEYVVAQYGVEVAELEEHLAPGATPVELVEVLFTEEEAPPDPRLMLAYQALATAAPPEYPPAMRAPLLNSMERFLDVIAQALQGAAPAAPPHDLVRSVAQGIASARLSVDALSPLSPPPTAWHAELKRSASILAATLEHTS